MTKNTSATIPDKETLEKLTKKSMCKPMHHSDIIVYGVSQSVMYEILTGSFFRQKLCVPDRCQIHLLTHTSMLQCIYFGGITKMKVMNSLITLLLEIKRFQYFNFETKQQSVAAFIIPQTKEVQTKMFATEAHSYCFLGQKGCFACQIL